MSKFTDQQYLTTDQYKDASNLDARLEIHKRFSANPYGWFNWIFDTLAKLPKDANVLELGSGSGALWLNIADRIPSNWNITLSDLSQGMLDAAWRNLVVTGRNFKFEQIDAQSIPYKDETFDIVIANHMIYHVPDRSKALSEVKRVLKRGGHLIATTVGESHMKELTDWLQRVDNDNDFSPFILPFTLENGMEQLENVFSKVTVLRYEDSLQVTDIDLLIAYLRSAIRASEVSEDELAKVKTDLEKEIKQNGKIFITKDSGLFEALK
ncbi:MAG: methyltransferase domain-containing protein [Anaerolineales bacterium]|nr:methyltransferase domain-containing protein [Anaerolineales bacterium]